MYARRFGAADVWYLFSLVSLGFLLMHLIATRLLLVLTVLIWGVTGTNAEDATELTKEASSGPSKEDDFVSSLEAAIALGASLDPFNLVGEFTASSVYPEGLTETESRRFRFVRSKADKFCAIAIELRRENLRKETKTLHLYSTVVRDRAVTTTSASNSVRTVFASSFDEATAPIRFPHPAYWGIFKFPSTIDNRGEFLKLKGRIYADSSEAEVVGSEQGLKCLLKEVRGPNHTDVWRWDLALPDLNPTYLRLDRALNGPSRMVMEQTLLWEEVQGKLRPVQIVGSIGLVRPVEGQSKLTIGRKSYDLQVAWLPMQELRGVRLRNDVEIKKFIEEGFKEVR